MKKSALKILAQNAKHRMKTGYVTEERADKSLLPSMEKEEKRIYQKMVEMACEETVFNPLGRLVDHAVYDKLDQSQKERYVLNLSNTYLKILNKGLLLKKNI